MMMMMLVVGWFADWQMYLYCRHCSERRIVDWQPKKRDGDIVVIWRRSRQVGPSAVDDGGDDNASSLVANV